MQCAFWRKHVENHQLPWTPTPFLVKSSVTTGHSMPERVPIPLERPIRMLAKRGAMSRWFTLKPVKKNEGNFKTVTDILHSVLIIIINIMVISIKLSECFSHKELYSKTLLKRSTKDGRLCFVISVIWYIH